MHACVHACVSSRGAQSTELVWILDFKQILLLLLFVIVPWAFQCNSLMYFGGPFGANTVVPV